MKGEVWMMKKDGGMDGKDAVGVQVGKGRFPALMAALGTALGGCLAALWAPVRRYFYLTKRDAQGFAVWCGIMGLTLAAKWAYPKWEAARLSKDRLPAVPAMPAAGAGTGGFGKFGGAVAGGRMAGASGWQAAGGYGAAGQAAGNGTGTSASSGGLVASGGPAASSGGHGSWPAASPDTARPSPRAASPSPYGSPYRKKAFTIDLNLGDTLDFQQLRGIGPAYARRIVAYRERLGGFVDKRQLMEVWGVDSALYDRIAPSLELASGPGQTVRPTRPLYINCMSVQELKQHPYLDYYQAKEIVRFRERYGTFKTAADLRKVNLMDAETYRRIAPYVSTAIPPADTPPSSSTPTSANPAASTPSAFSSADTAAVSTDPP